MSSAEFKASERIARLPEASQAHSLEPNRTTLINTAYWLRRLFCSMPSRAGDNDDPSSPMYYLVFLDREPIIPRCREGAKNSDLGQVFPTRISTD